MKTEWGKVKLGEVLRHRKEFITIDDLTNYKRPRVQLHVKGIVLRDEVSGVLIKTKMDRIKTNTRNGRARSPNAPRFPVLSQHCGGFGETALPMFPK
jgi:hypothetical protein